MAASSGETDSWPSVSVVLTVRNEAPHLRAALDAVLGQDYPGPFEVAVAVGPSRDATEHIARQIAEEDPRVSVLANPTGRTPHGLNLAIAATAGEVVVRVDGHSILPAGYIRRAVEVLRETGADNVGGVQAAEGATDVERAVAAAMSSPFGVGDARFHYGGEPGEVDTVYLGVFRRSALERVGGYDETFIRAQDAELNHRIRVTGGAVWFTPELRVAYRPRGDLRGLARQYHGSGRWRRVVVRRHPESLAWRQVVPPATLLGLVTGLGLLLAGRRRLGLVPPAVYGAGVLAASAVVGRELDGRARRWLPLVFPTMHLSWAWGFLSSPRSLGDEGAQ